MSVLCVRSMLQEHLQGTFSKVYEIVPSTETKTEYCPNTKEINTATGGIVSFIHKS